MPERSLHQVDGAAAVEGMARVGVAQFLAGPRGGSNVYGLSVEEGRVYGLEANRQTPTSAPGPAGWGRGNQLDGPRRFTTSMRRVLPLGSLACKDSADIAFSMQNPNHPQALGAHEVIDANVFEPLHRPNP